MRFTLVPLPQQQPHFQLQQQKLAQQPQLQIQV